MSLENEKALNEDFNLSTGVSTTVLELAGLIWKKINPGKPFRYFSDEPFTYDVRKRVPDISKARKILGFEAKTSLDDALDEIIPWIKQQIETGGI
jgi:nucleoside-diphosphate-sugar epimerase